MRTVEQIDQEISDLKEKLNNIKGRDTEVYKRIVGYYREIKGWNNGKREEMRQRKHYKKI